MAGIEVASLVLAVLPVLFSATENFDKCIRPFTRYRNFAIELDHYQRLLKTQKTIFRNQCLLLLDSASDHDVAVKMLSAPGHPSWSDQDLDSRLLSSLGSSRDSCLDVVRMITECLRGIENESRKFGVDVGQCSKDQSNAGKWSQRKIKKKLEFCFSQSHLEQNISTLRTLNDDFITLSKQTRKAVQRRTSGSTTSTVYRDEVMKYRTIGKASQLVYETLGTACTKHSEHLAHFCMEAEHCVLEETSSPQVKFRMAYTHQSFGTFTANGDPTWFVIDSIVADSAQKTRDDSSFQVLARSLKRSLDPVPDEPPKKSKKCVRFAGSSPPIQKPSPLESYPTMPSVSIEPRMRQDLCDFLRGWKSRPRQADVCVGLIENPGRCRHRLYAPPCSAEFTNQQAMPLSQLISDISQTRTMGQADTIPIYERLRLAKALATAVLQYQSTPWLKLTWRSEDIFFFDQGKGSTPVDKMSDLSAPHVNVRVKGPDGALSRVSTFPPHSLAPNPLLFSLGIVLIELAYSSPLRELQKPADQEKGQEDQFTEFFAAKRLADSVARETCIPYSKIVKKLLQCDFGCGDDLTDPQLQAGFHRDVVCELDKLEKGFRSLHLGI